MQAPACFFFTLTFLLLCCARERLDVMQRDIKRQYLGLAQDTDRGCPSYLILWWRLVIPSQIGGLITSLFISLPLYKHVSVFLF